MKDKIEIIYEDRELVVCHKMPGTPVQTAKVGQLDMVSLLSNYFAGKKERTDIYIVHRLDQPVEGIMVFARTKQAAAALSRQSREKNMDKYYIALAEGIFEPSHGEFENYLLRDGKKNTSQVVSKDTIGAKKAKLSFKVKKVWHPKKEPGKAGMLDNQEENSLNVPISLLEIKLHTGRHHQIRVQMAHAGHPLVGDKKYNPNCTAGYLPVGLCSVKLSFFHPGTGESMEFTVKPKGAAFSQWEA